MRISSRVKSLRICGCAVSYLLVLQAAIWMLLGNSLPIGPATAAFPTPEDTGTNIVDGILIRSISTRYELASGSFHIFGEILNSNKDQSAANIVITATFFHSSTDTGSLIGKMSGSPYIRFLNPGESSAFELITHGQAASLLADFSYYQLSATWGAVRETKPGFLNLRVDNVVLDPCGTFHVRGLITNYDRHDTKDIIVSAAFYNDKDQILATSHVKLVEGQEKLVPTKSHSFDIVIDKAVVHQFAYYRLNGQSDNYSVFLRDIEDSGLTLSHPRRMDASNVPTIRVFSNSTSYPLGNNDIKIFGTIHDTESGSTEHQTYALIKIMTPDGRIVDRATAPVLANGTFSRVVDFLALGGSEGQVYMIRAEYDGAAAVNTFLVEYDEIGNSADDAEETDKNGNEKLSSEQKCAVIL